MTPNNGGHENDQFLVIHRRLNAQSWIQNFLTYFSGVDHPLMGISVTKTQSQARPPRHVELYEDGDKR